MKFSNFKSKFNFDDGSSRLCCRLLAVFSLGLSASTEPSIAVVVVEVVGQW